MGIEPDIEYGLDCPVCFPIGFTPKNVWVSFAGIRKGAGWFPWMPFPPNGIYKIPQLGGCHWAKVFAIVQVHYWANKPGTQIDLIVPAVAWAFFSFDPLNCLTADGNQITEPPNRPYAGGNVKIGWQG